MCGIVGIVGDIAGSTTNSSDIKCFRDLLVMDTLRGPHSTGVMSSGPAKDNKDQWAVLWDKEAVTGAEYAYEGYLDSFLIDSADNKKGDLSHLTAVVGHNRFATQGEVNKENGHPFHFGNIIGVHNGTLGSFSGSASNMVTGLKDDEDSIHEVDSARLFYNINKYGWKEVLESVRGSFCVVFFDLKEGTMNIARNSRRPMSVAFCPRKETMVFSSEAGMLRCAIGRMSTRKDWTVKTLPTGELWSFSIGANTFTQRRDMVENRQVTKFTPYTTTTVYDNGYGGGNYPFGRRAGTSTRNSVGGTTGSAESNGFRYRAGGGVCKLLGRLSVDENTKLAKTGLYQLHDTIEVRPTDDVPVRIEDECVRNPYRPNHYEVHACLKGGKYAITSGFVEECLVTVPDGVYIPPKRRVQLNLGVVGLRGKVARVAKSDVRWFCTKYRYWTYKRRLTYILDPQTVSFTEGKDKKPRHFLPPQSTNGSSGRPSPSQRPLRPFREQSPAEVEELCGSVAMDQDGQWWWFVVPKDKLMMCYVNEVMKGQSQKLLVWKHQPSSAENLGCKPIPMEGPLTPPIGGGLWPEHVVTEMRFNLGDLPTRAAQMRDSSAGPHTLPGPSNENIPQREWFRRTGDGCANCGRDLLVADAETISWKKDGGSTYYPVCMECAAEAEFENNDPVVH